MKQRNKAGRNRIIRYESQSVNENMESGEKHWTLKAWPPGGAGTPETRNARCVHANHPRE